MPGQGQRLRAPVVCTLRVCDLLAVTIFFSVVAYCAYDGFKELFPNPADFKPKEAGESIAELKVSIAKSRASSLQQYTRAGKRLERRSALSMETPSPPPKEHYYLPEEEPPKVATVIMVSALQEEPCSAEGGDELHYLSVLNKQDYARRHGMEFVLGVEQVDPKLENMWNKPAWISKVLEEQRSDWVLWVDIDTVILDADFELPYHQYFGQSKDLVIYGNRTMVKAGHPIQGLNTGVMLIHNTPWSRHLFAQVNTLGRLDDHHKGKKTLSEIFLKELSVEGYSDGLRDQNAVVYLLKTHPEWHTKVAFVDKEVCLNCYWRDLVGVTGFAKPDYERTENVSFIQHFMGCQTCSALNRNGDLATCRSAMFHSYRYAAERQREAIATMAPRTQAQLQQLRRLPYCSFNTSAEGCAGATPRSRAPPASGRNVDWNLHDASVVASVTMQVRQQAGRNATGKPASSRAAANASERRPAQRKERKMRARVRRSGQA